MEDLRSAVRAAFDKDQAAHPPATDLRRNVVRAVSTHAPHRRNVQWIAVVATVIIGALVVGGLLSTRLMRGMVPTSPHAAVGDYGPPPAGVALIYMQDPNHAGWYIGFDWSGKPRGTIKLSPALETQAIMAQAPDGSALAISAEGKGGYQQFLDRLGRPSGSDSLHYQSEIWADDSRHLCILDNVWRIGLMSPGKPPASVHPVAIDPSTIPSGILALALTSCSPAGDRAIVTFNYFGAPAQVWIVRISDGSILFHATYPTEMLSDVVASHDGTLIAENSSESVGYIGGPTAAHTAIRRVADGNVVLNLVPTDGVLAFNADDSLALVYTSPLTYGLATRLAVIDLRTGAIVWRSDGRQEYGGSLVQPDGTGFAVFLHDPSDTTPHALSSLVIVHGDGTSIAVPGQYPHP